MRILSEERHLPSRRETLALTDYSLRKPILVLLVLAVVLIAGVISYDRLGVDLFPPVHFPLVNVTVADPGASPSQVIRQLTVPIENALTVLPHIKHVHSTVLPGVTIVTAVFDDSSLDGTPERQVKEAMDHLARTLPAGLAPPQITRENPTRLPLMWIIFPLPDTSGKGEGRSGPLSYIRNTLVTSLMRVRGVESIRILSPPVEDVHVYLHRSGIKSTPVSITELAAELENASKEYPAGFLSTGGRYMNLLSRGSALTLESLSGYPVLLPSGKILPLGKIATIRTERSQSDYLFRFDGKMAVALKVYAVSGANFITVSRNIQNILKTVISPSAFPSGTPPALSGIRSYIRMDRSIPVSTNNRELLETLVLGAILAIFVIFVFLGDIRETAVAALAIPASVLATFPLLYMAHFTLNNLTMLGLSLVVGILIDDAIVVLENINRHRMMGETLYQAARFGVGEIGRAVLATTFSIVAVFAPMAMMHGVLGEFFTQFGWTVSFAVLASLLVSLSVSPILMVLVPAGIHDEKKRSHLFRSIAALGEALKSRYVSLLEISMDHPYSLTAICTVLLAGSIFLGSHLGWNLIPEEDQGAYVVHMNLEGSPNLEKTDRAATDISGEIRKIPGVVSVFHEVGGGEGTPPSEGYLYVNLVDRAKRSLSDSDYMEKTRRILATFAGVRASVDSISPLGGTEESAPFQCFLLGPDPSELRDLSKKMQEFLQSINGLRDVRTSSAGLRDLLVVRPSEHNLPQWRISSGRIAEWLSSLTTGRSGGKVETSGGPMKIFVSLDPSEVNNLKKISILPFPVSATKTLPLEAVANISLERTEQRLNRDDGMPSVTISANIKPPMSLGEAMSTLNGWSKVHLPPHYHIRYSGNSDVLNDAREQFSGALIVAVLVVFSLLSFQFNSLVLPFVIMISIPFSIVGAVLGLWISGIPVNIMSAIGLIILFGLVTKNAILLVDYANTLQKRGRSVREAALESASVRLRPISMTTFAMIFGMAPMAIGWGAGGAVRESMAMVVIGGLATSMFFTLLLVPVAYERVATLGKFELGGEDIQKQDEGGRE